MINESVISENARVTAESGTNSLSRRPLFQEIQRRIRNYIFERGLKPGDMMPSAAEMAAYLGVSSASLREGLRAMEALGMLETQHGVGTFVCSYNLLPIFENLSFSLLFDTDGLYKLTQIREAMEIGLIRDVVEQITEEDLDKLDVFCRETAQSGWHPEYDTFFHGQIYQCLNNELVAQILEVYWRTSTTLIDENYFTEKDRQDNWEDHYRIVTALKARDVNAAIESIHLHFARAKARIIAPAKTNPHPNP